MTTRKYLYPALGILLFSTACERQVEEVQTGQQFETAPVQYRDIDISVEASGTIQPETTVDVKSKASGEILVLNAETGDRVKEGSLLVQIDKRTPRNTVDQAQADLEAARARRQIAETQINRTKNLLDKGIVTETDYETTKLELANAEAQVISSQVELENARIALDDADIRAPITGTIIEKNVERGQVISSSTRDVGEGTILLKMANLGTVQVRTLVDETDIGKITPGMPVTVRVAAFPRQPFTGEVLKIEPLAIVDQNVTMFPVIIRLENEDGMLRPGMNAEVDISIAHAEDVLAVPTMAIRTARDIPSTAAMLGMDETALRQALAGGMNGSDRASGPDRSADTDVNTAPGDMGERPAALAGKRRNTASGGDFWVVLRKNGNYVPRLVEPGISDFGYTQIISGLQADEQVVMLPTTETFDRREQIQERLNQRMRMPGM